MTQLLDGESRRPLEWPGERRFYLTLDFECDYGTALSTNRYGAVGRVDELCSLVEQYDVPLTVFVQTEVLDVRPEAVESLRDIDVPVEFHPHSHTHDARPETDVSEEITRSTERFREFFGDEPAGYRFPDGDLRQGDYSAMAESGYEFDASLFPSWRPRRFDHRGEPTVPYLVAEHDIYEVPFTTFSDSLRVPTSLSYCRLMGWPSIKLLARRTKRPIVFNIHMHDLFNPESFAELPPLYRGIYARNADGFAMLDRVLDTCCGTDRSFELFESLIGDLPRP